MTTQQEAINWLNSQVGQHLDYDKQYDQECVDFFNYYYQFVTGESPYSVGYSVPSAYMIWGVTNDHFAKIPDSGNLNPVPGDIAVYGAGWGAGNGHVEVVVSTDAGGCTFVGENEHNNKYEGVVRVYRTWAQMRGLLGVMRPNWASPPPAGPPFTVVETYPGGKLVKTTKQPTFKWGMNYDNLQAMSDNPVLSVDAGTMLNVTNRVHHNIGYDYYRTGEDVDGWNVQDCADYTVPAPYIPPAAPVPVIKAEKYEVLADLPYFGSVDDLTHNRNQVGILHPGTYYVWDKQGTNGNYWNLSMENQKNQSLWINIVNNKKPLNPPVVVPDPEPVTEPLPPSEPVLKPSQVPIGAENDTFWKSTYKSFHSDRHSDTYQLLMNVDMKEYSGKRKTVPMTAGTKVNIVGTFIKNGVTFYRPRANNDEYFQWYYGISQTDDDGNANLVKLMSDLDLAEKRLTDFFHYWKSDLKDIMDIYVLKRKKKK